MYKRQILLGLLVGIISGLLGAGGGVMILLILVFVMGYKMHEGVGTSTPVSYTHLDVYKRQPLCILEISARFS